MHTPFCLAATTLRLLHFTVLLSPPLSLIGSLSLCSFCCSTLASTTISHFNNLYLSYADNSLPSLAALHENHVPLTSKSSSRPVSQSQTPCLLFAFDLASLAVFAPAHQDTSRLFIFSGYTQPALFTQQTTSIRSSVLAPRKLGIPCHSVYSHFTFVQAPGQQLRLVLRVSL